MDEEEKVEEEEEVEAVTIVGKNQLSLRGDFEKDPLILGNLLQLLFSLGGYATFLGGGYAN